LFRDFLGFATTLKEQSDIVFDLDRYFRETGFKKVKFGKREEIAEDWDSDNQIVIYTLWEWEHRSLWGTQIKSEQANNLVTEILTWIHKQASEAKRKDMVFIILIGHGNENGIVPGRRHVRSRCRMFIFPADVIKACFSGLFANAFKVTNQRNDYTHTCAQTYEKSYSTTGSIRQVRLAGVYEPLEVCTRDPDEIWTLQT
jgi:hypothetical protein